MDYLRSFRVGYRELLTKSRCFSRGHLTEGKMGAHFEMRHANFVAYLTDAKGDTAPRADAEQLSTFLMSLMYNGALISSTQGLPYDWTERVANIARREYENLGFDGHNKLLDPAYIEQRLTQLRPLFTGYDLYGMVIPSGDWRIDRDSYQFFSESAVSTGGKGLILFPELEYGCQVAQVIDPFAPIKMLSEFPAAPPCVIFWTDDGAGCVLPLHQAKKFFRTELLYALENGSEAVKRSLIRMSSRQRARKILHLSDLHIGTKESIHRRSWLKEHIRGIVTKTDRVVVTGDLFNTPDESLRSSFDELRFDVENITGSDIIIVPGNHDVRSRGNAIGPFGRNSDYVTDLRWDPIVFDHEIGIVFFCFNSSEEGNLATGSVTERQRLDRAELFDRELRKNSEIDRYLKIALVHHHPCAYESAPTSLYEKLLEKIFGGDERFLSFTNADDFLRWCSSRGVSLVLHGHKHTPRFFQDKNMTIIGCGSTVGVEGKPMCYDIALVDPDTKRWNAQFYFDDKGDGSGFKLQNVTIDLRR